VQRLPAAFPGYERLNGEIPVVYAPETEEWASELSLLLNTGAAALSTLLGVGLPELEAMLIADEAWNEAPREGERAYPKGLPYFTRSARPQALVLPATLSPVFRPRTQATYPLVVWHELPKPGRGAHDLLLQEKGVGQLVPNDQGISCLRAGPEDGGERRGQHQGWRPGAPREVRKSFRVGALAFTRRLVTVLVSVQHRFQLG
jgi:hypothetical protein